MNETTGQFQWSFVGWLGNSIYDKRAPDNIIVKDDRAYSVTLWDGNGVSAHNATTGEFLWRATPYGFGNITNLSTWHVSGKVLKGDPLEDNTVYAIGDNCS